jgi:outer membrane protein assembly factor BamB
MFALRVEGSGMRNEEVKRSRRSVRCVATVATLCLVSCLADAADWPQWRGAARDGRSAETGLLLEWPADGPPLLWRSDGFGGGFSSLAVAGGRIYTMGDIGDDQFVIAAKQDGGEILWKRRVGPAWTDTYGGSRSTPTVDGDRVYAIGTEGDLVCLSAESGKEIWRRALTEDFDGRMMEAGGRYNWKFSESPLVVDGLVVVTPGIPSAALVGLDKKTGEEIWRAAVPDLGDNGLDGAGYASAVISEAAGVRQVVQLLGRGLVGVEASSGRFLWGYNRIANHVANIPTPIVTGDYVFASTGYGAGAVLLRLRAKGEGVVAEEVYFVGPETLQNHHGGLVLHEGHVYAGTGLNKGFPVSLELKTGALAWGPIRNDGRNSAAVSYADGHLYLRYQNGLMVLVEATHEAYRERGSFMIPDVKKESWSHPVIAHGMLFLREQDHLLCYDLRAPVRR